MSRQLPLNSLPPEADFARSRFHPAANLHDTQTTLNPGFCGAVTFLPTAPVCKFFNECQAHRSVTTDPAWCPRHNYEIATPIVESAAYTGGGENHPRTTTITRT